MRENDKRGGGSGFQRRRFVKTVGGTAVGLSIAGCVGDDPDVGEGDEDDGVGTPADDEVQDDDIDEDEWPDLEGREVHILTQESSEPYQEYWQWLAARFHAATGAYVRMEYTGFGVGLNERIAQLIQGGDPPELSHMGHPDASTYSHLGILADHTEAVEHWEDKWGEIPDGAKYVEDGEHALLPMLTNVHTNWYRDDVFEEVPDTWESQLAMAEQHDEGEGGTRGAGISMFIDNNLTQIDLYSYGWSNGVQFFGREGGDGDVYPAFAEDYVDETVETLEYIRDLYQYSDDNLDLGGGDQIQMVGGERSYQVHWVGSRPKFYGEGQPFASDIRPCPIPGKDGNNTPWGHVQGYASFQESDHEAAMEFLKFWAEEENFMEFYFADPIHNAPVIDEIIQSDGYQAELDQLPDYWNVPEDLNFDWIPLGRELPAETEPPNQHGGLIYNSQEMVALVSDVCVDGLDPEQAIENRAANLRDVMD